jgi:hypothetical protein
LTIAAVLALLVAAATSGVAVATDQRPFTGEFTVGAVGAEQRCGDGALTIGFAGSGLASHLGRIRGTDPNCTDFDLAVAAVPIYAGFFRGQGGIRRPALPRRPRGAARRRSSSS